VNAAEGIALVLFVLVVMVWHHAGGWLAIAAIVAIFAAYQIARGGETP